MGVSILQSASEQLQSMPEYVRIIVLHPNFQGKRRILSEFLGHDFHYVELTGKKLALKDIRQQVEAGLQDSSESQTMILDAYDRAQPKALLSYLKQFVEHNAIWRVVLIGRTIPHMLLNDEQLRQCSALLPTDDSVLLTNYLQSNEAEHTLEVSVFGKGRVVLDGRPITNWDGVLPRILFFYLVDRGMATRNDIFDTFWPNMPKREATNVFHVTKRKINEILGIDLTKYWSGFYRIAPEIQLNYDAVRFTEMVHNSAVAHGQPAIDLLQRAFVLYRGHFLTGTNMPWVNRRREELIQDYGEALFSLGERLEAMGHHVDALGYYLRSVPYDDLRITTLEAIMRLYREQSNHSDALAVYRYMMDIIREHQDSDPITSIRDLAADIEREMVALHLP